MQQGPYKGKPLSNMNNTAWQSAWRKAGLPVCKEFLRGVHNLKHTMGRRLEGADVPYHLRQVLLGHKTKDVREHYSAVQIKRLVDAANSIYDNPHDSPTVALVKRQGAKKEIS
jgi:integrase